MASSDKELEKQLAEAGNKLLDPPLSEDELIPLLHKLESCLAKVDQSPPKSMHDALAPSQKALVAEKIFKHSNVDVKVAVAACISEITRITAPDAPYEDDQMKEVFQLIVASFEDLADMSSQSYSKRISILETVAKVRSCVVMLDLECEGLIIEMFQHFLKAIRDEHPGSVFQNMATIMTLVLDESEDVSVELLSPLLASVKKGNEETLPIARKLGENVLENSASKVKPYLTNALKSLGISVGDYSDVVGFICQDSNGTVEQSEAADKAKGDGDKLVGGASADEASKPNEEIAAEVTSEQQDPGNAKSPEDKSVMTNGVSQTEEDDSLAVSSKKQEDVSSTDVVNNNGSTVQPETSDTEKRVDMDDKDERTSKKEQQNEQQNDSLTNLTDNSGPANEDKNEEEKLDDEKGQEEGIPSSPPMDLTGEANESSEIQKEKSIEPSSSKTFESEQVTVAVSPSVTETVPDESVVKEGEQPEEKESETKDDTPSATDIPEKTSKVVNAVEPKITQKRSKRKGTAGSSSENKTSKMVEASKKQSATSDSEAKPIKQSSKKTDIVTKKDGSSLQHSDDKKKRNQEKAISQKNIVLSSTGDDGDKEMDSSPKTAEKIKSDEVHMEETPKTSSKRKRSEEKEKKANSKEDGEDLVGLRVKVWWPKDRMFYDGVIESFDPVKKKHKVSYTDGDVEILNLKKEKWEIIKGEIEQDKEAEADQAVVDTSSDLPSKKKAKASSSQSTKEAASSKSKSKSAGSKSGGKTKDTPKIDGKSIADLKFLGKKDTGGKSKEHTPKTESTSAGGASKTGSKSKSEEVGTLKAKAKDVGVSTPKIGSKSKQDTPKTGGKSKQQQTPKTSSSTKLKAPKGGSKSNANISGSSKKEKETEETEEMEYSAESTGKEKDSTKGKSPSSTSTKGGQGSKVKSGKKRPRGA